MGHQDKTIFVMIPAYRDPVLRETLDSMFENASNPDRVFAAIAAQYDEEIPMPSLDGIPDKNIRLLAIHPENRPGVYQLRSILNSLYANEDYYLSVDSHTVFSAGWDEGLIAKLESFEDRKTVLQSYELEYEEGSSKYTHYQMSVSLDNEVGFPRVVMRDVFERDLPAEDLPIANYVMAGAIFTRGSFAKEIRWGSLWQNDQEEPFLSFEMFMLGWTSRLMVKEKFFQHNPEKYYEAVYNSLPDSHNRDLKDNWKVQKDDLSDVCPKIFEAMMCNSGPFKVLGAVRSPKDWWYSVGLGEDYETYKDYFSV